MKYKILILLITLFATLPTQAQKKYDAIFKNITKNYVLNQDGSIDYTYRKELQLNSQRSFDKMYGETFIIYNPEYQTLTINEAYTIRKDGSQVNTPANAFNEVLPSNCTDCGRYSGVKEMVVTHTALEYGATIVLDYTIHQKAGLLQDMSEIIIPAESSPVEKYQVNISFPKDKHYYFKSETEEPVLKQQDGYKTLSWTFKHVRQTSAEPYLPAAIELYPYIKFTSADNDEMLEKIIKQPSLAPTALPECDLVLSQITSADKEYIDNILAIRDWVVDNVHYNSLSFKHNGYNIADAQTVWNSNCGNEPEKAVLLAAMLQRAGYDARIGVMMRGIDKSVAVAAINRWAVWTRDPLTNKMLTLSPVAKTQCSLTALHPDEEMILFNPEPEQPFEMIITLPENSTSITGAIVMKEDGQAEGTLSANISNSNLPSFSLRKQDNTKTFNTFLKNIKVDAIETRRLDVHEGWHIDYAVNEWKPQNLGSGYFSVALPEDKFSETVAANRLTATRHEVLACKPVTANYNMTFHFPENCTVISKSVKMSEKHDFGDMEIRYTVNPNGTVTISRQLTITHNRITPSQYAAFRKMMVLWNDETYRRIVFKKSEK